MRRISALGVVLAVGGACSTEFEAYKAQMKDELAGPACEVPVIRDCVRWTPAQCDREARELVDFCAPFVHDKTGDSVSVAERSEARAILEPCVNRRLPTYGGRFIVLDDPSCPERLAEAVGSDKVSTLERNIEFARSRAAVDGAEAQTEASE